ncbi:MAG TPA: hypothetical protein VMP08_06885 [Anaerolineae bacterium]|nr:hypothetical protein [Anaerolineae bacterium]
MSVDSTWAERALHHARHIAARIGPRGAATPEEKQAAEYAQRQLQQLGLRDVRVETFSATSFGWQPITIIFSMAVWGVFVCWALFYLMQALTTSANAVTTGSAATMLSLPGAIVAAILCCVALGLLYREVTLRDHPLRRLSHGTSYNTIGHLQPVGSIKQRVVLVSSLDTPPAAPVLKTPRRARLFRVVFYIGSVSLVGSVVLYLLGGLNLWEWAFVFAGIFGLLQSAVIIQSLRADHGDLTPGANSNASGVGTVLALAERLRGAPLQNTEVWVACCGSHTSGGNGLRELLRHYSNELNAAWFIGFEGVGIGDRLIVINREGWLRRSIQPAARDLIARAAAAYPDRSIEFRATSRNTVVAAALWRGCKSVCLSLYDKRNDIPNAYNLGDIVDRLQSSALDTAQEFGWQLLQQIDRG